jgi:uncharacterized protein (TIGR03435 family)
MSEMKRVAAVLLIAGWAAAGQGLAPPSFEVASVKAAAPCCAPGQWRESKAGDDRIDFRYVNLKYCIAFAYGVKEFQISGPPWMGEARFDIVAKAVAGTKHDQLPKLLQALLAERFRMQVHREPKEFSVVVLSVGKGGPKLQESPVDPNAPAGAAIGLSMNANGIGRMEVKRGTMTSLANSLVRVLGRPVVDKTELTGRYDFELEYSREDAGGMAVQAAGAPQVQPASEFGVSVFAAIQKLGLKLDVQKLTLETIVVDQAEKVPTEN